MRTRRKWLPLPFVSLLLSAGLPAQTLTEFALPEGARPTEIAVGPDGNLWFGDASYPGSRIGRMTPAGDVTLFLSGVRAGFSLVDIAAGPDGNVWFTCMDLSDFGSVIRIRPSGEHTEFELPGGATRVTTGPDGNLWLTQVIGAIARMTPAGHLTNFPTRQPGGTRDITSGPDGNLWFTYDDRPWIGRITRAGVVTDFPVSAPPDRITSGPDGNLWFTSEGRSIGRMTTSGAVTEFPIPWRAVNLVAAPDGNIWFTYTYIGYSRLGRIATDGTLLPEVPIPDVAWGLTVGADGNVWFTEPRGKIGRIELARAPAIDSVILPVVGSTAGVGGSFFRTAVQLHNGTAEPMAGRIVFHASGVPGGEADPALAYSLAPGQTRSIADLLPAIGLSGLGSVDVEVTAGSVPAMTARVFNDAGAAGTTGFTEEPMRAVDALRAGESGVLILPADPTRFRFNLGVRTLGTESSTTLTLRDASGAIVGTVTRAFPATYHEQRSAGELLGISTLPPGGSIGISIDSGSAIFYGATVDNTTGDPSFQVARPAARP